LIREKINIYANTTIGRYVDWYGHAT